MSLSRISLKNNEKRLLGLGVGDGVGFGVGGGVLEKN